MPAENHTTLTPDTPVRYLKGVGPKTAERFEKLGIVTLADLLCHYPRRYIDFTKPYSIAEAPTDAECVVRAEVFAKPGGRILPGGRRMERITAGDDVSSLEITWFNNPYAAQKLQLGQEYVDNNPSFCVLTFEICVSSISSLMLCPITPSICVLGTSALSCCGAIIQIPASIIPAATIFAFVNLNFYISCLYIYFIKVITIPIFCKQSITMIFINRPPMIGLIHFRIIRNACNVIR